MTLLWLWTGVIHVYAQSQYEIWFDSDYDNRSTANMTSVYGLTASLPIDHLPAGLHCLNFRTVDSNGSYGLLLRKMFVYAPELAVPSREMMAYEMWIDNDYDSRIADEATGSELALTYNLSKLRSGLHTFNFRAIGNGNLPGVLTRRMICLAPEESVSAFAFEYSIDGGEPVTVDAAGTGCDFSVDLSGLRDGFHTLSVRTQSPDGRWGPVFTRTFELTGIPLDASEWTLLLALYNELQTMGWKPEWNMAGGAAAASGFDGVEVTDGHVTGFSFNDKGLRSTSKSMIPLSMLSFPYLQNVDLSGNGLAGEVDKIFAAAARQGKSMALHSISNLNLSDNLFCGNLGILGAPEVLPSLKTLNASRNGFADVYPAVPSTVDLDYSHQCIDRVIPVGIKELRDIDFEALRGIDFSNPESIDILEKLPPTITLYNHNRQTWLPPQAYVLSKAEPDNINAIENINEWTISVGWNEYGPYVPYLSEDFYVYYGESGDILNAIVATTGSLGKLYNSGTNFKVKFNYEDGDVNLDGNVNVVDLQSIINYIFEIYNMQNVKPFIFNSANRQKGDDIIDIKDAVLMVSMLLDKKITPATRSGHTSPLAFNSGGYLCISSARPVSAFELTLLGDDDIMITRALKQAGFTCEISRREGFSRVVAYSLDGKTLPAGVTQIGSIGLCDVTDVVLSDAYAEVILEPSDTISDVNILDTDDSGVDIAYSNGVITITSPRALTNVKWTVYTVDGKVAACGEAESLGAGKSAIRCGIISEGIAVAVIEADQTPASRRKIMIHNY